MSDRSDPPSGERPPSASSHKGPKGVTPRGSWLPKSVTLDRFDKAIILFIIAVFLVLFVWLLLKNIQPSIYAYWTFTALLTLIFVGFLRATGIFRTTWGALGGSVAVYVGLLLLTGSAFNRYAPFAIEFNELHHPARSALQQHFSFLQQGNFKGAYDIFSDAQKTDRRRDHPEADDFNAYVSAFDNTKGYRNFTYDLVREETDNERRYRVTYDAEDSVPHNTLFDNSRKAISSFSETVDKDKVISIVVDNIRDYYDVSDTAIPAIQNYIRARTIEDLLDPTFIGELVIALKDTKNIQLKRKMNHPNDASVWRYFRYDNVIMIKQAGAEWKIRSGLDHAVIGLYK